MKFSNFQPQTFTLGKTEGNISLRHDLGEDKVEDLTQLQDLHEASLLWNLRGRYEASNFYTYAGSILVSINPYTMYPDLYGLEMAKKYSEAVLGESLKLKAYQMMYSSNNSIALQRSTATSSLCYWQSSILSLGQSETKSNCYRQRRVRKWKNRIQQTNHAISRCHCSRGRN